MSWWFAPFYDGFMRRTEEASLREWRRELLEGASGEVLDLGAGTGANLPFFSVDRARVVAAEPDVAMARRLRDRARGKAHVDVVHARAEELPFADGAFDVVVSTLVLCTVDDQPRALDEIRRVLKPGGRLLFLEHVASEDPSRHRWQRALDRPWSACAGGCHLTRRTHDAIAQRLEVVTLLRESMRKALPIFRETVRGVAVK